MKNIYNIKSWSILPPKVESTVENGFGRTLAELVEYFCFDWTAVFNFGSLLLIMGGVVFKLLAKKKF